MKKILSLIIVFLFLLSPTYAAVMNEKPQTSLLRPSDRSIMTELYFTWQYFDIESDEQEAYLFQVDDDWRFYSPINLYGFKGTSITLGLDLEEGEYCWRVMSKDASSWGDWSEYRCFTYDKGRKVCDDGTPYWRCSATPPLYCDGGVLTDHCKKCGCDINQICQETGYCSKLKCSDGTAYGECSRSKPLYCQAGNLINLCTLCGCTEGKSCRGDGGCGLVLVVEEPRPKTLLEIIVGFFKSIFHA